MITAVIGKPDSGKSFYAEKLAVMSGALHRYYIATMKVMDEEGEERVRKHRRMRRGKGFITLEIPEDIIGAAGRIKYPQNSVIVLECMSNLAGNIMHLPGTHESLVSDPGPENIGRCADGIIERVRDLSEHAKELIVVSTTYARAKEDDEDTRIYKILMDAVNDRLKYMADRVFKI